MIRTAIFISGNGSNMEAILEQTASGELKDVLDVVLVFSDKKQALGLKKAEERGVKTLYLKQYYKNREKGERELLRVLKELQVEFILLAGYMRILSPLFIQAYPKRIINIHPADVEAYKGVAGYVWAFEKKLAKTYISVHLVNEEVDAGELLHKEPFSIPKGISLSDLKALGLSVEHRIYSFVIKNYVAKQGKAFFKKIKEKKKKSEET